MVYMKYLLSKTGWFPKWERDVSDVLTAAVNSFDVKNIVTSRGWKYYYIIPKSYKTRYLYDLSRVFRANGVLLRPHKSHNYNSVVFRVPNHGQPFMRDVMRVNKDKNKFKQIAGEHGVMLSDADLLNMISRVNWHYGR